jgi:hypothetical protein
MVVTVGVCVLSSLSHAAASHLYDPSISSSFFLPLCSLPPPYSRLLSIHCALPFFLSSLSLLSSFILFLLLPLLSPHPIVTADSKNEDFYSDITEPSGWNETLDQAWRGAVQQAVSPTILMECVLLLEHYINKAWLQVQLRG